MQQPQQQVIPPYEFPIWIKAATILVFAAFACACTSVPANIDATRKLHLGEYQYEEGKYKEAVATYEELLKAHPKSESLKIDCAKALFKLGNVQSDARALGLLEGIKLSKYQWEEIKEVMPAKYQDVFEVTKGKEEEKKGENKKD